jgi:methionyl-tRNA formyltransferase
MADSGGPALRVVFMGTAEFAVPALHSLAAGRHRVLAVYTQPARPAGRGMQPHPSPVERVTERLGLPVRTPVSLREPAEQTAFAALEPDLCVVAAYGLILPKGILDVPPLGCINLHASLLPRWRGAAPIQRSLLAGDSETGVTIFRMEPSLDTGPTLAIERLPIAASATAGELHDRLAELAARMLPPVVEELAAGRARAVPQPVDGVTYAAKIDKSEGWLDWSEPAAALERRLRAFDPWPGCWTEILGQRVRVLGGVVVESGGAPGEVLDDCLTIACGQGALRLTEVQRAGGKPMPADAFLRGFPVPPGTRLGRPCPATS